MNKFEEELKNNNFLCSKCIKCNKLVWPPNDFCNMCLNDVVWFPVSRVAKIVEFSSKDNEFFCIAEFDGGIKVMGKVENASNLQVGQQLFLIKCNYDGKEIFTFQQISKA